MSIQHINQEKPILIFGSNGNLGTQLVSNLESKYIGAVVPLTRKDCDVMDIENVEKKIIDIKPSVVINAVAYNNVDACEKNIEEQRKAIKLNVSFVECLASICQRVNAKLIHFSTNYVFSRNENEYIEKDVASPVNFYGLTKLMGEQAILKRLDTGLDASVIRISNLFGPCGNGKDCKPSFFDVIYKVAKEKGSLNVINDEYNCFTYTIDVAKRVTELLEKDNFKGVFHFVNNEPMTWYEAACIYFELLGEQININPTKSEEYQRIAKRPTRAVMKSTRIPPLRGFKEAMKDYIQC